jgi:prephenate dehydrogenase
LFKQILIVGVGLIGSSFALGLRAAHGPLRVLGMDRDPSHLAQAQQLGIIDAACDDWEQAMRGTELVVLAAPVAQTGAILRALAPHLQSGTLITDTGSTKADVVAAARAALGEKIACFIPGHPIAGREKNGPQAALADLYRNKKAVLTPCAENAAADVEKVARAWRACGAIVHFLTPEQHDLIFAAVSHLPHLLAYALVDDIAHKPHADLLFQYAASGFRDFTRIAGSSPEMWRDISLANQGALLNELDAYIIQLGRVRSQLAARDGAALQAVYANAQQARHDWIRMIELGEKAAREGGD